MLPDCNLCSAATQQLGHVQGGMRVCVCVCVGLLPLYGVQRDGSRFLHVLPQQHLAVRPVQVGHLDTGRPRVRPVQLIVDPVDGQSTCDKKKMNPFYEQFRS